MNSYKIKNVDEMTIDELIGQVIMVGLPDLYLDDKYKEFVENFKLLVKDEEEFKRFLEMISLTLDDFLHLGVYVCPNAFTSTLIKYIQTNYLNIKVVKKTKTRTKK